jgi:hypothetical protein
LVEQADRAAHKHGERDPRLHEVAATVRRLAQEMITHIIKEERILFPFVRDVPGVFVRSLFPDATGEALRRHGSAVVDDETPFDQRWGGWDVTVYKHRAPHRGNTFAAEQDDQLVLTPSEQRPDELSGFLDTKVYLRPTSDMAALLVAEHQMSMQNTITRAGLVCRQMIADLHGLQATFKEPVTDERPYDSVKSVFAGTLQDIVHHLLFRRAARCPRAS